MEGMIVEGGDGNPGCEKKVGTQVFGWFGDPKRHERLHNFISTANRMVGWSTQKFPTPSSFCCKFEVDFALTEVVCKICQVMTTFRAPVKFTPDSDSITIDFTSKGGPAVPRTSKTLGFYGISLVDASELQTSHMVDSQIL